MTNTDGERFAVYSATGVPLKEVGSFIQVKNLVDASPETVFDSSVPEDKARIEAIHSNFVYEFGPNVQPQHIRVAWNRYNNYPGF